MGRIRKEPEVRQQELMDAALELFSSVGYEKTMVNDIARKAGVAKGTFFYHFPTKEAVLDAICMRGGTELATSFYFQSNQLLALQKLQAFILLMFTPAPIDKLFDRLWDERQLNLIYTTWHKQAQNIFNPILREIIKQGISEGTMQVQFIDETIAFFWSTIECLWDNIYLNESTEMFQTKTLIAETVLERILGIAEGQLPLSLPIN